MTQEYKNGFSLGQSISSLPYETGMGWTYPDSLIHAGGNGTIFEGDCGEPAYCSPNITFVPESDRQHSVALEFIVIPSEGGSTVRENEIYPLDTENLSGLANRIVELGDAISFYSGWIKSDFRVTLVNGQGDEENGGQWTYQIEYVISAPFDPDFKIVILHIYTYWHDVINGVDSVDSTSVTKVLAARGYSAGRKITIGTGSNLRPEIGNQVVYSFPALTNSKRMFFVIKMAGNSFAFGTIPYDFFSPGGDGGHGIQKSVKPGDIVIFTKDKDKRGIAVRLMQSGITLFDGNIYGYFWNRDDYGSTAVMGSPFLGHIDHQTMTIPNITIFDKDGNTDTVHISNSVTQIPNFIGSGGLENIYRIASLNWDDIVSAEKRPDIAGKDFKREYDQLANNPNFSRWLYRSKYKFVNGYVVWIDDGTLLLLADNENHDHTTPWYALKLNDEKRKDE